MQFFQQFLNKEINEDEFLRQLIDLTTKIQKKSQLTQQDIQEISKSVSKIENECYNKNVEVFIKFGLYVSNRGVYDYLFKTGFENITISDENCDANQLGLYIIKRVYHAENYKNMILFLNDILRDQKTIEKKLILLEIFVQILPKIEKRELHLAMIYAVILVAINEGLQKYLSYKKQKLENTLNEDNKFTQLYLHNFEEWTISFFKRIFEVIRKYPEMQTKNVAIKELFGIDSMFEYYEHQVTVKAEDPCLLVKHYTLLFLTDLFQGILEAQQSLQDQQLEPATVHKLLEVANNLLNEIHDNKLELIENYLIWLRYCQQNSVQIPVQYHYYSKMQPYNPVAMCYLVYELLSNNKFEQILSNSYKLKLTIGVLFEQNKLSNAKCDVQSKILSLIVKYLTIDQKQYQIASYYQTQFDVILLLIMEKAGSGLQDEQPYINAWLKSQENFRLVWPKILEQCIHKSQNYLLLSCLVNKYRSFQVKEDGQQLLQNYNIIIQAINKKEVGTIDQNVQLVDALFLLIHQAIKKIGKNDLTIKGWIKGLTKYEKEFQQAFDYLESKKIAEDQEKVKNDMAYQALLQSENQLRIAYYNLKCVLDLVKE